MQPRKHSVPRVAFRYVAGRPLDGLTRTDATFLRPAERILTPSGRAGTWSRLPGWKRALWRLATPASAALVTVGYLTHPAETIAGTGAALTSGTSLLAYRGYRAYLNWNHVRTYVEPLHRALGSALGLAHTDHRKWLEVPINFHDEESGAEVKILLPDRMHMSPETKATIREIIGHKLGMTDATERYHLVGLEPYVSFRPAPRPPGSVSWADVAEAARKASDTAPVLGLGTRGTVIDADLEAESPHLLVSAGSGGGKSVLIKTVLAQGLNRGAGAVILDYKRHSHSWAAGLPGVLYCRDIGDIHDVLVALGAEGERRNRESDNPNRAPFHRIYLVAEEMNATIFKLQAYWEEVREKSDPKSSPAIAALRDVLFMGRAVDMNVLAVAQMMTARTLGGPEARENFATRCLTRYTLNAWKMLTPEIWPAPKRSKVVGRWQICKAGTAYETQIAFMTDDEARAWAMEGTANPAHVLMSQSPSNPPMQAVEAGTVPALTAERVGLRAAAELLPGAPISLEALRGHRKRTNSFPAPVGKEGNEDVYMLDDLVQWKKRRDAVSIVDGKVA